jgi:short-subunit dehydrogenase
MAGEYLERYGPVALVTGASSGIGLAFAEELAERGFDLVLAARRMDRMEALAARLKETHGTASTIVECDLSDPAAPAELLKATQGVDIGLLVSNAGFNLKGAFETKDANRMAKMLTVNCHAPMQLAHGFIPRLKARGRGGIVFTSSVEGLIGCPYSTAYAASKALVVSLGEGLWGELQDSGVDVLTLCPGATQSEATEAVGMKPEDCQPAREVAQLTLDQIADGPTFVPNERYRAMFDQLRAAPRRETLAGMAKSMKAYAS